LIASYIDICESTIKEGLCCHHGYNPLVIYAAEPRTKARRNGGVYKLELRRNSNTVSSEVFAHIRYIGAEKLEVVESVRLDEFLWKGSHSEVVCWWHLSTIT